MIGNGFFGDVGGEIALMGFSTALISAAIAYGAIRKITRMNQMPPSERRALGQIALVILILTCCIVTLVGLVYGGCGVLMTRN